MVELNSIVGLVQCDCDLAGDEVCVSRAPYPVSTANAVRATRRREPDDGNPDDHDSDEGISDDGVADEDISDEGVADDSRVDRVQNGGKLHLRDKGEPRQPDEAPRAAEAVTRRWPRCILIVDDHDEVRVMLGAWFEACGIPVVAAEDAVQAREALRRHVDVDLALVDIWMPGEDGYALVRTIRQRERTHRAAGSGANQRRLPVFAISADPSESARQTAQAAGFDGFLGKPLQLKGLLARLRQQLGLASASSTSGVDESND